MKVRIVLAALLLSGLLSACRAIPPRQTPHPGLSKELPLAERQTIYEDRKVSIQVWFVPIDLLLSAWPFKGLAHGNPVCVGKDCRIGSLDLDDYFRESGCPRAEALVDRSDVSVALSGFSYLGGALLLGSVFNGTRGYFEHSAETGLGLLALSLGSAVVNDLWLLPRATSEFNRCLREQLGLPEPQGSFEGFRENHPDLKQSFFLWGVVEATPGGIYPTVGYYGEDRGARLSAGGGSFGADSVSGAELGLTSRVFSTHRQRLSLLAMGGYQNKKDEGSGGYFGLGLEHIFWRGIFELGAIYLPWRGTQGELTFKAQLGLVRWY